MLRIIRSGTLLSICLILFQHHAIGQDVSNTITLSGKVEVIEDSSGLFYSPPNSIEDDPAALPGAIVVIMELDSTIVAGAVTNQEKGTFEIEGLTHGDYILKTSSVGYENRFESLVIESNKPPFLEITLGNIYQASDLPFHETQAEKDLKDGIIQFKIWARIIGGPHRLEDQKLQDEFGFDVVHVYERFADVYDQKWEKFRQASIRYNIVVDEYLSKKYPKQWKNLH